MWLYFSFVYLNSNFVLKCLFCNILYGSVSVATVRFVIWCIAAMLKEQCMYLL